MHPVFNSDKLKEATAAYYQGDWSALQNINLSMLEGNEDNEFLIWHIADTYIKLGDVRKALEFAEKLPEGDEHRDDIFIKAAHISEPKIDDDIKF